MPGIGSFKATLPSGGHRGGGSLRAATISAPATRVFTNSRISVVSERDCVARRPRGVLAVRGTTHTVRRSLGEPAGGSRSSRCRSPAVFTVTTATQGLWILAVPGFLFFVFQLVTFIRESRRRPRPAPSPPPAERPTSAASRDIHAAVAWRGAGWTTYLTSRPCRCAATRPARSRTARCLITAGRLTGSSAARVVAVPWPWVARRSRMVRRVGSASAVKTSSVTR